MIALLNSSRVQIALLFTVTLIAYATAFNAGFIWDDEDYITQNPVLREWSGIFSIWFDPMSLPQYYPVVHTTFWLEFRMWGLEASGYHLVNILIHATNACILMQVLKRLSVPGAFFAALLFAVHPVHVESVAWITERKNVLSGTFYLLSLTVWLRWVDSHSDGSPAGTQRRAWILAFFLFVAALLSKTVTCSLPAVFLLISYWRNGGLSGREFRASLPFFAVGLGLGLMTAALEVAHVRAEGADFAFTAGDRILIAGRALWFYLGSLLWPIGNAFNYERWQLDTGSLLQWCFPIAAVGFAGALALLRHRIGRAPLVVALIFGGSLVPALGFFNVYPMRYSFVADHFQYLANTAPFALFAAFVTKLAAEKSDALKLSLAALLIVCLGVLTSIHARTYKSLDTLWAHTLEKNPKSWLALINLAQLQMGRGENAAALAGILRALEVTEGPEIRMAYGLALLQKGDLSAARQELERSIELDPKRNTSMSWLGLVLHRLGENQKAREVLEACLAIREDYDRPLTFLGMVLQATGKNREAIGYLERAMELNPMAIDAFRAAARAHLALGERDKAVNYALNGLRRVPGDLESQACFVEVMTQALRSLPPERAAVLAKRVMDAVPPGGRVTASLIVQSLSKVSPDVGRAVGGALGSK